MAVRITCGECGWCSNPCRSQAQADYALRRHSCAKERARQAAARRGRARRAAVDRTPKPCPHKRTTHQHGTHACYVLDRCKCPPCSAANSAYEKNRARQRAYGRQAYVDAGPTRAHVLALRAAGMGLKQVAKVSGVPHGAVAKLIYGDHQRGQAPSRRIRWETAVRLQVVRADATTLAGAASVDATGTRRRVQALVAIGWSLSRIGARLGMAATNFGRAIANDRVQLRTARAVADLYEQLWDTPPPHAEHHDLIAYNRARNYAAARGWAPPGAWLDIDMDDPAAHPNATGYDEPRVAAVLAGALADGDDDALALSLALTRADRIEALRRGHLAYPWHSDAQVCARLGLDIAQLTRDKEAVRAGRTERGAAELDEIAVARIMAGTLAVPAGPNARYGAELAEAIRRLAARGLDDTHVGERVGRSKDAVTQIRTRNGIPAGVPRHEPGSGWTSRTARSTSSAARSTASEDVAAQLPEDAVPA